MSETTTAVRLHGIDLARALAIIGMVYAHLGPVEMNTLWLQIGDALTTGFASATFAVLAGVSLSIMSRNPSPETTHRLLARGVILMAAGTLLELIQSSIYIVLVAIGIIFVVLHPVTHWRTRWIVLLFTLLVPLSAGLQVFSAWMGTSATVLSSPYPAVTWLTYGTLGILIHRTLVKSLLLQITFCILGIVVAAAGLLLRALLDDPQKMPQLLWIFISPEPHDGGIIDVLASCGAALTTITLCLVIARCFSKPLYPLRALGAMSLTFYVCHIITAGPILDAQHQSETTGVNPLQQPTVSTVAAVSDPMETHWSEYQDLVRSHNTYTEFSAEEAQFFERIYSHHQDNLKDTYAESPNHMPVFWTTLIVGLLFAPIWRLFFRRGPFEWAMHSLIERSVSSPVSKELADKAPKTSIAAGIDLQNGNQSKGGSHGRNTSPEGRLS
ncbi:MAG: heparan-alpha-glucosaminide N-acetyltransferase domain-containing protein [Corynebacterium sp.]|nr:heparan-alpha-glucosaminide N-acetyltransferase domain-containing protein [Corynebacterium sp.]